jgi:hypothetical protein
MTGTGTSADWRLAAASRSADPDLFFPSRKGPAEQIAQANQFCAGCQVRRQCLSSRSRPGVRYLRRYRYGGPAAGTPAHSAGPRQERFRGLIRILRTAPEWLRP